MPVTYRLAVFLCFLSWITLDAGCFSGEIALNGSHQVTTGDGGGLLPSETSPDTNPPPEYPPFPVPEGDDPCADLQPHDFDPVRQPHPRIWITPGRLATMRKHHEANNIFWQQLVRAADYEQRSLPRAAAAALIYAITADEGYAATAKSIALEQASSYEDHTGDYYRGDSEHLPLVFDWIYDKLSASEKKTLVKVMNTAAQRDVDEWSILGTDSDLITGASKTTLLIGIATAGDNTQALEFREAALARWYEGATDWLGGRQSIRNTFIARSAGGVWMEGPKYSPDTMRYVYEFVEAEKSASGKDLLCELKQEKGLDYDRDTIMAALNMTMPGYEDGFTWSSIEDPWWPMQYERYAGLMIFSTHRKRGSQEAKWAYYLMNHGRTTVSDVPSPLAGVLHGHFNFEAVIFPFLDFEQPEENLTSLPFDWVAEGPGTVFARTGNDAQATGVSMQNGSIHRVDHVHFDTTSFQMYRQGEWLTREVRGYGLWAGLSRAHNTILLDGIGPQEKMQYVYGEGKLVASCLAPEFTYAAGDATAAYNIDTARNPQDPAPEDRAAEVVRQFVFIRPEGFLVIFDRLETKKAAQQKELVFLTMSKPALGEQHFTSKSIKGSNDTGQNCEESNQLLQVRTIFPPNVSYTVVDEKAYYSVPRPEVGLNYVPGDSEVPPSEKRWHVLAKLPGQQTREYALHVLTGYDSGQQPPPIEALTESGKKGVRISAGTSTLELLFNEQGELGGTFRRINAGSTPVEKALSACP